MMKRLYFISICLAVGVLGTGCATASPEDYASIDCAGMRALVAGQNYDASVRGVELYTDRGLEETRQESGSPWAGRTRTSDEKDLRDERQAIREAYRRKGCKA